MASGERGIDRRELLLWAAATGLSLTLARCGGGGTSGTVAAVNGKVTLSLAQFPDLAGGGGGVVVTVQGGSPLLVIRKDSATAVAMSAVCTHQGCTVSYDSGTGGSSCPCHNSQFGPGGQVTAGPARVALALFPASIDSTGIVVTIG